MWFRNESNWSSSRQQASNVLAEMRLNASNDHDYLVLMIEIFLWFVQDLYLIRKSFHSNLLDDVVENCGRIERPNPGIQMMRYRAMETVHQIQLNAIILNIMNILDGVVLIF